MTFQEGWYWIGNPRRSHPCPIEIWRDHYGHLVCSTDRENDGAIHSLSTLKRRGCLFRGPIEIPQDLVFEDTNDTS